MKESKFDMSMDFSSEPDSSSQAQRQNEAEAQNQSLETTLQLELSSMGGKSESSSGQILEGQVYQVSDPTFHVSTIHNSDQSVAMSDSGQSKASFM